MIKNVPLEGKGKFYKTIVRPTNDILTDPEYWTLNKMKKQKCELNK